MTKYSLDILLSQFGISLLFYVWFLMLLLDLSTDSSGGRSGGLVFPPHFVVSHTIKGFGVVNEAEIDVFLELSHFFNDPVDVGNLISGSFDFSKSSLDIWKYTVEA